MAHKNHGFTDAQVADIKDKLAMLDGRGKYNTGSNICRGDHVFAASIHREFGYPVDDLRKMFGPKRRTKATATPKSEAGGVTISAIEIHEFVSGKPNGDRATFMTPCSHFKVQVFNPNKAEPFTAFDYNCFDAFHCGVEKRDRGLTAATEYAQNLAKAIGYKAEVRLRQFKEKIVSHTEWQEVA